MVACANGDPLPGGCVCSHQVSHPLLGNASCVLHCPSTCTQLLPSHSGGAGNARYKFASFWNRGIAFRAMTHCLESFWEMEEQAAKVSRLGKNKPGVRENGK